MTPDPNLIAAGVFFLLWAFFFGRHLWRHR